MCEWTWTGACVLTCVGPRLCVCMHTTLINPNHSCPYVLFSPVILDGYYASMYISRAVMLVSKGHAILFWFLGLFTRSYTCCACCVVYLLHIDHKNICDFHRKFVSEIGCVRRSHFSQSALKASLCLISGAFFICIHM